MKYASLSVLLLALPLGSCSVSVKSPVPGVKNKVRTALPNGLEYSTVLTSIKIAIADALKEVRALQNQHPTHPINALQFQTGNATLSTIVQTDVNDAGGITTVIPFSNLAGTQATPGLLGLARNANSKQLKALEFSIDPSSLYKASKEPELLDIRIKNGLRDALIADFDALLQIPPGSGIKIQPRKITHTFTLSVTRTGTGNVTVSIVPTTPSITGIGPSISTRRTDSTTSELTVTLPLAFPAPTADAQPVQFFYEVHGTKGSAWIQTPYTEEELKKIIGDRVATVPAKTLTPDQWRELLQAPTIEKNSTPPLKPKSMPPQIRTLPIPQDPPSF